MTLAENLKALRTEKGLSQEEVAGALFLSRQSVSKWENGQAEPGVENLKPWPGSTGSPWTGCCWRRGSPLPRRSRGQAATPRVEPPQ